MMSLWAHDLRWPCSYSSICLCPLPSCMSCFPHEICHMFVLEVAGFVSSQRFWCYCITKATQGHVCSPSSSSADLYFLSLARSISGQSLEQPWFTVLIAPNQGLFYKLSFVPLTRLPAVWICSLTDSLTYAAWLNIYANVVRPLWKPQAVLLKRPPCTYKVKLGMSFSREGRKYLNFKVYIWKCEIFKANKTVKCKVLCRLRKTWK